MAVATLSPWPTTPAALAAALACLRTAGVAESSDDRLDGIGAAAGAMVDQYAPGAPQALKNEATVRFASYLAEAPAFRAVEKKTVGPLDIQYSANANHATAFRNSGAAGLLSRWRVRRAGAIG